MAQQPLYPPVTGQQLYPPPTGDQLYPPVAGQQPPPMDRGARILQFIQQYELNPIISENFEELSNYDIVLVIDESSISELVNTLERGITVGLASSFTFTSAISLATVAPESVCIYEAPELEP